MSQVVRSLEASFPEGRVVAAQEEIDRETGYSIDIVLDSAVLARAGLVPQHPRRALEVDGPFHFLSVRPNCLHWH